MKYNGQIVFKTLRGKMMMVEGPLLASVVLCPHCDKTHFGVTTRDTGITVKLDLTPQEAEALAAELINPSTTGERDT